MIKIKVGQQWKRSRVGTVQAISETMVVMEQEGREFAIMQSTLLAEWVLEPTIPVGHRRLKEGEPVLRGDSSTCGIGWTLHDAGDVQPEHLPDVIYIRPLPPMDGYRYCSREEAEDFQMCCWMKDSWVPIGRFQPDYPDSTYRYRCREAETFDRNRSSSWRDSVDADGVPTCGPERCDHGCQYCFGPLDAVEGVGQYECPWCIARFPAAGGLDMKYFVLKPKGTDIYAVASREAMLAYARSLRLGNPTLATQLIEWVRRVS